MKISFGVSLTFIVLFFFYPFLYAFPAFNKSPSTNFLVFTENLGQILNQDGQSREDIKFSLQASGISIHLTIKGISYTWLRAKQDQSSWNDNTLLSFQKSLLRQQSLFSQPSYQVEQLGMEWIGANPNPTIYALEATTDYSNYYAAAFPNGIIQVKNYKRIVYENLYDQIDLVLYIQENRLKYDFVVKPGGDPKAIRFQYIGSHKQTLQANGALQIQGILGSLMEARPYSYIQNNKQQEVASSYFLQDDTVTFHIADYNKSATLIIDPELEWATYYGGGVYENSRGVDTDEEGNVYLSGSTTSYSNIAFNGFQNEYTPELAGLFASYIVKFNKQGQRLWATYFMGVLSISDHSLATGINGALYLSGLVNTNINIAYNGHQPMPGGDLDCFLVKFNSSGIREWATYYGGAEVEFVGSLATDQTGHVYLAGFTYSSDNIAFNGYQNTKNQVEDAFLVKFNAAGERIWGTYYGGERQDLGTDVTTDQEGNVYIAGHTNSTTAIAKAGFQQTLNGDYDTFLAKFTSTGTLQWATYYGGEGADNGVAINTDKQGNICLLGQTRSTTHIASNTTYNNLSGMEDGFLVKFSSLGSRLWAAYYGGTDFDAPADISIDPFGRIYIVGWTRSTSGIAYKGYQNTYGGGVSDGFIARFTREGIRDWSSYYGGTDSDLGTSIAHDKEGNSYISGQTLSADAIAYNGFHNSLTVGETTPSSVPFDAFLAKFTNDCLYPSPPVSIEGNRDVCLIQVTSEFTAPQPIDTNITYRWELSGGGELSESGNRVKVQWSQPGEYEVSIRSMNECGESEKKTIRVSVQPAAECFKVPNVITPNGDEMNEFFILPTIAHEPVQLEIINRYGVLIYENKNYLNNWNGKGNSGGVYYYRLSYPTIGLTYKGWLHLLR